MMKIFLILILFSAQCFAGGYMYVVNESGKRKCWPVKNYAEMQTVVKKREPGRGCKESKKTQEFECGGLGIEPTLYRYYDTEKECEREKAAQDRRDEE